MTGKWDTIRTCGEEVSHWKKGKKSHSVEFKSPKNNCTDRIYSRDEFCFTQSIFRPFWLVFVRHHFARSRLTSAKIEHTIYNSGISDTVLVFTWHFMKNNTRVTNTWVSTGKSHHKLQVANEFQGCTINYYQFQGFLIYLRKSKKNHKMAGEIQYFWHKKLVFSHVITAEIYRCICSRNSVGVLKNLLVYYPCPFLYSLKTYYAALAGIPLVIDNPMFLM